VVTEAVAQLKKQQQPEQALQLVDRASKLAGYGFSAAMEASLGL